MTLIKPLSRHSGPGFFCSNSRKRWRRISTLEAMAPSRRFPEIDDELRKILNANMDHAPARRRARDGFRDIQLGIDHILFKSYEANSKGLEIFTKRWLPEASFPKALVFYCHGYGDTCTFFFEGTNCKKVGLIQVWSFFHGFGLSEGLHGYIPSFDWLVDDVIENYSKVREDPEFYNLPSFLFGQSMGGAVALKIHLKQPNAWCGPILVAPMCKIADDMVPPWLLKQILIGVGNFLPRQKLVPQKDLAEAAFRDIKKRELTTYSVIAYKDKPRLRTAVEMLKTTQEIENSLNKISLPLLILHGEADSVTDPSVSKALYEKASSPDKKLKLYKDAYHSLLEGEPDEVINQVFNDIISWLDDHFRGTS